MTSILTDDIEINIEDSKWRLFNLQGKKQPDAVFLYRARGAAPLLHGLLAQASGLPGKLSCRRIMSRRLSVGFDEKNTTWRLGIQVALEATENRAS